MEEFTQKVILPDWQVFNNYATNNVPFVHIVAGVTPYKQVLFFLLVNIQH